MPRQKRPRWIANRPEVTGIVPQGVSGRGRTVMPLEEFEAIRLCDYQGMGQAEAAEKMSVSRQTLGRILRQARNRLAESLVTGKHLTVDGGCYRLAGQRRRRRRCSGTPHLPQKGEES